MGEIDLLGLLCGQVNALQSDLEEKSAPVFGVTLGIVTDTDDRKGLGRVRVRLPWLSNQVESAWARIVTPWGGQRRGSYFLPEVDDDVLVAFRHGDLSHAYVLGFLWSERQPPPASSSPRLERTELRSKRGSVIAFDDTQKKESITVRSPAGLEVAVDDGAQQVRIADREGTLQILVCTNGCTDATQGKAEISITAKTGNLSLNAPAGEVSIKGLRVNVEASAGLRLKGQPIDLNPPV